MSDDFCFSFLGFISQAIEIHCALIGPKKCVVSLLREKNSSSGPVIAEPGRNWANLIQFHDGKHR